MFQYKYLACKRCKSEHVLEDVNSKTGENILHCYDCGWYKSKSKTIENPFGVIIYFKISEFRKIVRTIETEEDYNKIIPPLMEDDDVNYLMFSTFWVHMIKRTKLK